MFVDVGRAEGSLLIVTPSQQSRKTGVHPNRNSDAQWPWEKKGLLALKGNPSPKQGKAGTTGPLGHSLENRLEQFLGQ